MESLSSNVEQPLVGGIWDVALSAAPLAFVDLEMTGLDARRDRIVEICIEKSVGAATVARLASLVLPDEPCATGADLHGIDHAALASAPSFASLAQQVVELLDGAVLVAHRAEHDVAFLVSELERCGRRWSCSFFLDTLALSRRAFPRRSHRLQRLVADLELGTFAPHRAESDVAALRALFGRLCQELAPATARDLWLASAVPRRSDPNTVEALRIAAERGHPVRLRYRAARGPAQTFAFHAREIRTDLDPPLVLGYLQRSRGRRELRVDRILSIEPIHHE
jgi:DNA polymerase-3 subunit epsilon